MYIIPWCKKYWETPNHQCKRECNIILVWMVFIKQGNIMLLRLKRILMGFYWPWILHYLKGCKHVTDAFPLATTEWQITAWVEGDEYDDCFSNYWKNMWYLTYAEKQLINFIAITYSGEDSMKFYVMRYLMIIRWFFDEHLYFIKPIHFQFSCV